MRPAAVGIAIAPAGHVLADGNTPVMYVGNWLDPGPRGGIWRYRLSGSAFDTATRIGSSALASCPVRRHM